MGTLRSSELLTAVTACREGVANMPRKQEIFDILNECDDCDPSQCCQSCDNVCILHEEIHNELYEILAKEEVENSHE
jgi:hypothetical protein